MPSFRTGTVTELLQERRGLQRVGTTLGRAFVLTDLTGPVDVGDDVVLNTTAVDLGLGTGGWHIVHWNLARRGWVEPGPGHIMKLRYTSLQRDTGAHEEAIAELPPELAGTPVVACTVHSQVACVAAAVAHARPGTRLAYVMTDGAALPIAVSDLVATLTERALLAGTITAGHAFGGDLEAVTVPSALLLARAVLEADAIVVGMGPGVVGTGTGLGTTAIEASGVLDAADAIGGDPILAVRASSGDARDRHRGISHHALTVLRLVRAQVTVPLPVGFEGRDPRPPDLDRHAIEEVDVPDMGSVLDRAGLRVTTMGRGPATDPLFFAAAGAAGILAANRVEAS
ncbi:MAG: DUF3866 family protein [Acidimicrobiales bacterium]